MDNRKFMREAISLSATSKTTPGTKPYAALVVKVGKVVGRGLNRAEANCDPTAHGEIEAIRDACRNLRTTDLSGCELYTSCEPCPMCVAAIYRAGIEKLYYAVPFEQDDRLMAKYADPSAKAPVFSHGGFRRDIGRDIDDRQLPAERLMSEEACEVLEDWWVKTKV
jgi:guanine deaminase